MHHLISWGFSASHMIRLVSSFPDLNTTYVSFLKMDLNVSADRPVTLTTTFPDSDMSENHSPPRNDIMMSII